MYNDIKTYLNENYPNVYKLDQVFKVEKAASSFKCS